MDDLKKKMASSLMKSLAKMMAADGEKDAKLGRLLRLAESVQGKTLNIVDLQTPADVHATTSEINRIGSAATRITFLDENGIGHIIIVV